MPVLANWAQNLDDLSPRRRRMVVFLAGALSILAMAPVFLWGVLFVTVPIVLRAVESAEREAPTWAWFKPLARWRLGRAASVGWWFGAGYHLAGTFWIGEAFLVEAEIFAWLLPFAVTALPAGLALFFAAATAATSFSAPLTSTAKSHVVRAIAFAVFVGLAEWLRGHIFTGFPWNVLGYAFAAPMMIMSASVFGIYGLTVLVVLATTVPMEILRRVPSLGTNARIGLLVAAGALPLTFLAWTVWDDGAARPIQSDAPNIRIVQPSVQQRDKWDPAQRRRIFDDHLLLTRQAPDGQLDDARAIDLVVWPEAAMPFLPLESEIALADIGAALALSPKRLTLLSGALRADRADPDAAPTARRRVFNSLIGFQAGEQARVVGSYDKIHLVPFGEYLPLQSVLEAIGLQQLSRLRGGFTSGPTPRPLMSIEGIGAVLPLICYEVIFPRQVIQGGLRPRVMVNVTNDGWFGNTTGPRQHLHMTQVRAVEEGVPIIRAANNGISALIDGHGRTIARLGLNVRGSLDAALPPALPAPFYARFGDLLFWLAICLGFVVVAVNHRRGHTP